MRPILPGADNAGGLAVQVEADESVEREVEVVHAVVGARDFAIEREQQRDGVFGDGVGRVGRDARDREAEFLRGGEIDAVETGAAQRDVLHAEPGERFEARPVHAVVHEDADRLRAVRGGGGFRGEAEVHETPLDVEPGGGALERFAVVGFGVEDDGLDHGDLAGVHFPHPLAVVADGAVGGELAHARDVEDGLCASRPAGRARAR